MCVWGGDTGGVGSMQETSTPCALFSFPFGCLWKISSGRRKLQCALSVSGSEKGQTNGGERFLNQRQRVVAGLAGSDSVGET